MSRIGKKPIEIPANIEVQIENRRIVVRGPKGELARQLPSDVEVHQEGNELRVLPGKQTQRGRISKNTRALWGLTRALIYNMIQGVSEGYEKRLEIEGVGYRASVENGSIVLHMGYSHPITLTPPEGVEFSTERNVVKVSGIDKEQVGEWAARVRAVRPVEPYKGKGIKYEGEVVRRKAGKKAGTA